MDNNSKINISSELYYKGSRIKTKVPVTFIKENLDKIFTKNNFEKYFNEEDFKRLSKFLPKDKSDNDEKEFIVNNLSIDIIDNKQSSNNFKFIHPMETFKNMLSRKYFTEEYQDHLERFKLEALEDYISKYVEKYELLTDRYAKSKSMIKEYSEDENILNEYNYINMVHDNIDSIINPKYSEASSSGYTTLNSDEEKEEELVVEQSEKNANETEEVKESEAVFEGSLSEERFKSLKMNKNQLTIRPRSLEEIQDFHRQEVDRYKNPHLPWTYFNPDGSTSIVAPVLKKIPSGASSKPRDHVMLKSDRPSYVTILCLARDAASRLPNGVGTRADICDLLKDSQYINERLSDSQLNNIVSGALDRLHYEKDPCVKYDLQKKLWIYLHKNREIDYAPWNEHLKKTESKVITSELDLHSDDNRNIIKEDVVEEASPVVFTQPIGIASSGKKSRKSDKMLKQKRKHS